MIGVNNIIFSIYPEILVLVALIVSILLSTSRVKNLIWIPITFLLLSAAFFLYQNQLFNCEQVQILGGSFLLDPLSNIFRFLVLIVSILIILGSIKYSEGFAHKGEYFILLLSALLGCMFLVGANDLIMIFIALETLGLSSIMLSGYSKYDVRSNESSLKYLLNSAGATSIFLFGLSIIYGLTGSTQLYEIKYVLSEMNHTNDLNSSIVLLAIILIIAGLGFKLSAAPFHMWSPDVYEGAPTPTTAFLSVASKAAAVALSIRILFYEFNFLSNLWQPIIIFLAVLSMVLGNLIALGQAINKSSIKRLMAYSSIAQIGYILIGLALSTPEAISASVFYMIVYAIMNIGAFLCIIAFGNIANSDSISDYAGLIKKRPLLTLAFSVCLFNLGGLPVPPAGFIAKFVLLKASFAAGPLGLILGTIALVTTIISIYYYCYIAKIMIADDPLNVVNKIDSNKESLGNSMPLNFAIGASVVGVFLTVALTNPILFLSNKTAKMCSKCPCHAKASIYSTKDNN